MHNWFECKVKYTKIDEKSGKDKSVTEPYLFDAVSFTEAEARIYKELKAYISTDFAVTNIRKANYTDIFPNDNGDRWYRCKISFVSIDEKAGKEKKISNQILVMASNVKEAFENIHAELGMTIDFDVLSIAESPIMDFFPYFDGESDDTAKVVTTRAGQVESVVDNAYSEIEEAEEDAME